MWPSHTTCIMFKLFLPFIIIACFIDKSTENINLWLITVADTIFIFMNFSRHHGNLASLTHETKEFRQKRTQRIHILGIIAQRALWHFKDNVIQRKITLLRKESKFISFLSSFSKKTNYGVTWFCFLCASDR